MKSLLLTLAVLAALFSSPSAKAQEEDRHLELEDFKAGKWSVFSTEKHPKAGALNITIKHPFWWLPQEGDRPHVVQKFIRPASMTNAVLIIRDLGKEPSHQEVLQSLAVESMKKLLPPGAEFIDGDFVSIDGLPTSFMLYSVKQKSVGVELDVIMANWTFCYKAHMISLIGSVSTIAGQEDKLLKDLKEMLPVFQIMAQTIVVQNQWK